MELFFAMRRRIPWCPCVPKPWLRLFRDSGLLSGSRSSAGRAQPRQREYGKGHFGLRDVAFQTFQHALFDLLPQLLSVGYDPDGSDAHINAVVADLVKKGRRGTGVIAENLFDDNLDAMQASEASPRCLPLHFSRHEVEWH